MRLNTDMKHRVTSITLCIALMLVGVWLTQCGEKKEPQSVLAGYITVLCPEEILPVMTEEAYTFMDLYIKSKILVLSSGTNQALAAIFTDSAQVAVTTRPMSQVERERATAAAFDIYEYKVAKDGIAVIINQVNPVKQLTVEQVIKILVGKITNWSQVGGPNLGIRVCLWDENSGTNAYIKDSILGAAEYTAKAVRFDGTEKMVKYMYENPGSIGMVSMARLYQLWSPLVEDIRIKSVAIGRTQTGPFIMPDARTCHDGSYPFVRAIYMYTARKPMGLDSGFISYVMATAGQKVLIGNGLVPITIPVKYEKDSL